MEYSQLVADRERLQRVATALSHENKQLKQSVYTRESQILVLRPYKTDFARYHAQENFETLVNGIDNWVENWTDKFLKKEFVEQWLLHYPQTGIQFYQALDSHHDLSSTIGYPDTDQDILSAFILRFVWEKALAEIPCSSSSGTRELLDRIAHNMTLCTNPSLDMSVVHSWRAQAYHALFSDPEYSNIRRMRIDTLASELAQVLGFIPRPSKRAAFVGSISSQLIEPCISLYEQIQRSHEEFYLERVNPGTIGSQDRPEELYQRLRDDGINCRNVAEFCAIFLTNKLQPEPTEKELERHLHILCSIRPALKAREFQKSNGREAETLVKETVLVLWGPDLLQGGDPTELKSETWLSRVYAHGRDMAKVQEI
ncbi:hypothetical protein GGR58DRAFT_505782 [Xylaria digitata]|nr:hypothetical protein GGR58DRAFT_505782 [Xylaria digitata]